MLFVSYKQWLAIGLCSLLPLHSLTAAPEIWQSPHPKTFQSAGKAYSVFDTETENIRYTHQSLTFDHQATSYQVTNMGDYLQLDFAKGSLLSFDGQSYHLKALQLHFPAENLWQGKRPLAEGQLHYANDQGQKTVISFHFTLGAENYWFVYAWNLLPKVQDQSFTMRRKVSVEGLLPEIFHYQRYDGQISVNPDPSIPPQQGLRWLVVEEPVIYSKSQNWFFKETLRGTTNRPLSAIESRQLY